MTCSPLVRLAFLLVFVFSAAAASAQSSPKFESLGNDTYSVSVHATHKFTRNTKSLTAAALDAAKAFCEKEGKQLKVVSTDEDKNFYLVGGNANVTVVFQALETGDPQLAPEDAPQPQVFLHATPTDALYSELTKLDELRKRGILTEEEFAAEKKKVLERSK